MAMSYHDEVSALAQDAEKLEQMYQAAVQAGETGAFRQAIDDSHADAPENLLYAAWFHRLKYTAAQVKGYVVAWPWVVPLALVNTLLFWWLSDDRFTIAIKGFTGIGRDFMPAIILWAAALSAACVLVYLTAVGRKHWRLGALVGISLLAASAYVFLTYPQAGPVPFQQQYLTLMALHLPLLAWAGVGLFLIANHRDPTNRFSFLIKSFEAFILGGLFIIAGGLFTAITIGLFDALGINFPEVMQRLFVAGGLGMITVVATAVVYDPAVSPAGQSFDEGLSKSVALLLRVLLPLTLLVLLVYLFFIPFNFWAPFENRDVLIIYNGMLFAVVVLLVGATPVSQADLSPHLARWLRRGIVAVAALALIVSLYALAAILYRTALDRLTPNRLAFIGWNVVNIGLLCLVLLFQARARVKQWLQGLYRAYSAGTVAYAAWTAIVILALPWVFGIDQGAVEALPRSVQEIVYDEPPPILLKCSDSPHIYLLDRGEKRWIEDIETFNDRGYLWRDVQIVPCDDLRNIRDGVSIPASAGPPPRP
jgi:hypothetical protein